MDETEIKQTEINDLTSLDEEIRINLNISKSKQNESLIVNNFVSFFEPLIQNLDSNVQSLRLSQVELQDQIKTLLSQISKIYEDEKRKLDLDEHVKRLVQTKKRLNSVQATILAVQNPLFDDYEGSEFEFSTKDDIKKKSVPVRSAPALPSKSLLTNEQMKTESQIRSFHYRSMNAYARHVKLVNDYLIYYSGGKTLNEVFARDTSKDKTDLDVIREQLKFVWDDTDEPSTWEQRMAKKYYDKLYKEYCICDLTFYEQNKVAMRWRIEKEVLIGKGQFICGDKRCSIRDGLKTWEVNFGYVEHGEKKNALVKLRLCPECSVKLNHHHKKKEYVKPLKVEKRKKVETDSESEEETIEVKKKTEVVKESKETKEGNMIILESNDSMWKSTPQVSNETKAREEEFEDYLEDLFF